MNQIRNLAVLIFCALFAFSPALEAMGGKKTSSGSRDVASDAFSGREVASVEHESKGVPQLITFDELKKLSPEARAEYIAGVRAMIVQLAAKGKKDFPMFAGGKSLQETYSLLEALLPEAHAQYQNTGINPAEIRPRSEMRRQHYINNMEKWTCDSSEAVFNYQVGTCVHKGGKRATLLTKCPAGYQPAFMKNAWLQQQMGSPSSKYCIPSGAWERLAPSRKKELSKDTGAASVESYFALNLLGGYEKQSGAEIALGGTQKAKTVAPHLAVPVQDPLRGNGYDCNAGNSKVKYDEDLGSCGIATTKSGQCAAGGWKKIYVVKQGWTEKQRKFFCVTPASWNQLSSARQEALEFPTGPNAATAAEREQAANGKGRKVYAAATAKLPESRPAATIDAPNDNPATSEVERSPAEEIVQGGAPCAGISKMTCGAKEKTAERRAAAKEWWTKNSNVCVFGGNISNFSSEDQKEKTCAAVYSFSKPKLHCYEGVICNPIIFGAKEDGTAYCSTKYSEATSDCNAQAASPNKWLEANVTSIKDEWNKLRSGMSQACGRNAVREYFCDECNIMMERLASLRLLALEKGGDGICHAPLMTYENVETRKTEESKAKQ